MTKSTNSKSIYELPLYLKFILIFIFFICGVGIFTLFSPAAMDWRSTFYPVSQIPFHPYQIKTFINLPWTALFLYPLHFFSENISAAINSSLNLVIIALLVIKRKGDLLSLVLTLTSFPFLGLLANGSIEWIPALCFIFQNSWGIPLLLAKPQSGFFAILAWFSPIKKKVLFLLPATLTIALSFIIYGNWLSKMIANILYMKISLFTVSISPFPWAIPLGLGLIFLILKYKPKDSEILGALATFCLVPYFVAHSLTILYALLSVSHRRLAILVWFLLWAFAILSKWSIFIHIIGLQ